MSGGPDPDCRRYPCWNDNTLVVKEIYNFVKRMLQLRREHLELANDASYSFWDNNELLLIERSGNRCYLLVVNCKEYPVHTTLPLSKKRIYKNIINGDEIRNKIKMEPFGFMILDIS